MDSISYRPYGVGKPMEMTIIQSSPWEREAILDPSNTTYECTRVRGSIVATYNPKAVSFKTIPGDNLVGLFDESPGEMPVVTDKAIRRFLEQPRGQLVVSSAGVPWLTSPANGRQGPKKTDVRTGPILKANNIEYIQGERLWKIHLEFETFINERPTAIVSDPPLILSNRWYAVDDTNWQHLRTRTYQGICTVRGDTLQTQFITGTRTDRLIDTFRSEFCAFSVPAGFQREVVKVSVTPDGNSAHYTVVDTEQIFNKSTNCPAIRIDVSDSSWLGTGTFMGALRHVGGISGLSIRGAGILGLSVASASATTIAGSGNSSGNGAGVALVNLAMESAQLAVSAITSQMPKGYKNVVVRVWGNQRTKRTSLVNYGLAVAETRLRMGAPGILNTSSREILVSQDSNNFVQISATINWGIDPVIGQITNIVSLDIERFLQGAIGNFNSTGRDIFATSILTSPDTDAGGYEHTQGLQNNPRFPMDQGTRGTAAAAPSSVALQTLVTQALESFDQQPGAVP